MSEVTREGAERLTPEELKEKKILEDRKLSPDTFELSSL